MNCRICGSTRVYRSQRRGILEGIFLRITFMAPYRCQDCGTRYTALNRRLKNKEHRKHRSLAEFVGMHGREFKLRRWAITVVTTILLLALSIMLLLRMIQL